MTKTRFYEKKKYDSYNIKNGLCIYCNTDAKEGVDCGKLLTDKDRQVFVHKYCLLFASGLSQHGEDHQGIDGFLVPDIQEEYRRGRRLKCFYCGMKTATIGCSSRGCRRCFHFKCGFQHESLFRFFDTFLAFCKDHRPQQNVTSTESDPATITCPICMDDVEARVSNQTLKTPCCNNTWFHRSCVQSQALSAGYFFRCAICNNQDQFQLEMKQFGIYIPEHDAAWEMEDNAFQDLYWRHDMCDIDQCKCPDGRKFNEASSKWELVLCDLCGSSGCHLACGGLTSINQDWACVMCSAMMSNATEVNCPSAGSPQKSPYSSPTGTGQSTWTAMKLNGKNPRTPLSSQTFRKKATSSKRPNSSHESLMQDFCCSADDSLASVGGSSGHKPFEPPDPVGSFDQCRPSTSRQGLEEADSKHKKGKKWKLSFRSKENALSLSPNLSFKKHSTWKTQPADLLKSKKSRSAETTYGLRTTLRMSMRPRNIALSRHSPLNVPVKKIKNQTTKCSPKNSKKICTIKPVSSTILYTVPFKTEADSSTISVKQDIVRAGQRVCTPGRIRNATISHPPDEEQLSSFSSNVPKAMSPNEKPWNGHVWNHRKSVADVDGSSTETKSLPVSPDQDAGSVGEGFTGPAGFRNNAQQFQNATVTCPADEEPLSRFAATLPSSEACPEKVSSKIRNCTELGPLSMHQADSEPNKKCNGEQQSAVPDRSKSPLPTLDTHSPALVDETENSDTRRCSSGTPDLTSHQVSSCLPTDFAGCSAGTDSPADLLQQEGDGTSSDIIGPGDIKNDLQQHATVTRPAAAFSSNIAEEAFLKEKPNKVKNSKKHRYPAVGRHTNYRKKQKGMKLKSSTQHSTDFPQGSKSPSLALDTGDSSVGEKGETSSSKRSRLEAQLHLTNQSPSCLQADLSHCDSFRDTSGCSVDYLPYIWGGYDDADHECGLASTSRTEDVTEAVNTKNARKEGQREPPGLNEDTVSCPSPSLSRRLSDSPHQLPHGPAPHFPSPGCCSTPAFHKKVIRDRESIREKESQLLGSTSHEHQDVSVRQTSDCVPDGFTSTVPGVPSELSEVETRGIGVLESQLPVTPFHQHEESSPLHSLDSMQNMATPIKPPASLKLNGDKSSLDNVQLSDDMAGESSFPEVQQMQNRDSGNPAIANRIVCPSENPLGTQATDGVVQSRGEKRKRRKNRKIKYPVIGTNGHFAKAYKESTRKKRTKSTCNRGADGPKSVDPHQRNWQDTVRLRDRSIGTSLMPTSQDASTKAVDQGTAGHSSDMLLKQGHPKGERRNIPGEECTQHSIAKVPSQELTRVTSSPGSPGGLVSVTTYENKSISPHLEGFETGGSCSAMEGFRDSPRDESCRRQDASWSSDSKDGATQSSGRLLRRKYSKNQEQSLKDFAADTAEKKSERERPGSSALHKPNQVAEVASDGATKDGVAHDEKISKPPGNEMGKVATEMPSSTGQTSSSEASPDSGISQGYSYNHDDSPPEKPPMITMTDEPAVLNMKAEMHHDLILDGESIREKESRLPGSTSHQHQEISVQQHFDCVPQGSTAATPQVSSKLRKVYTRVNGRFSSPNKPDGDDIIVLESQLPVDRFQQCQESIPLQSLDSMQNVSTPTKPVAATELNGDKFSLDSLQLSDNKANESSFSEVQHIHNRDSAEQAVANGIVCQSDNPLGTQVHVAVNVPKSKKRKKLKNGYPVIGSGKYFTLTKKKSSKKRPKGLQGAVDPHQNSQGTCQLSDRAIGTSWLPTSQTTNTKAVDRGTAGYSSDMLLRPRRPEGSHGQIGKIPDEERTRCSVRKEPSQEFSITSVNGISESFTTKAGSDPKTIRSGTRCSARSSRRSSDGSGASVPSPRLQMNLDHNPPESPGLFSLVPETPLVKPTQLKPFWTFSGRDGHSSPESCGTSREPQSCPGKYQTDRDEEDNNKNSSDETHRMLSTRYRQTLCSRVWENLFRVREEQCRPLKRPRTDIPTRPVSPLVSGNDLKAPNKTRIYISNSPDPTSFKDAVETKSPKCQKDPVSGSPIHEPGPDDGGFPKSSNSTRVITPKAESHQRSRLLCAQSKSRKDLPSAESDPPLPPPSINKVFPGDPRTVVNATPDSSRQQQGRGKTRVYLSNSPQTKSARKPAAGKSLNSPQESPSESANLKPMCQGRVDSSLAVTPKEGPQRDASSSRPRLLRSCSKKRDKPSSAELVSPLCSPLPSSPSVTSPKQPRIYHALPPKLSPYHKQGRLERSSSSPLPKTDSPNNPEPLKLNSETSSPRHPGKIPSSTLGCLPRQSNASKCPTGPPPSPRREAVGNRKTKGRVQLFTT